MLKVAVLLFDGVEELDFTGPLEVLAHVGETFTVAPSRTVRGCHGLTVTADYTLGSAPQPDLLVVPGGPVVRERPESLAEAESYLRQVAPGCRLMLSVGTGAFLLARAGLLDGRSCTTHYRRRHQLAAQFPSLQIHYGRVVTDGKIISTAGVAAGIDGALHTVSRLFGTERARKLARQIEYPWPSSHPIHAPGPDAAAEERAWA